MLPDNLVTRDPLTRACLLIEIGWYTYLQCYVLGKATCKGPHCDCGSGHMWRDALKLIPRARPMVLS